MKIAALVTVLALASGSAWAQYGGKSSDTERAARGSSAATAQPKDAAKTGGEGLGAKTKRAFSRAGDKIRNTGERIGRAVNKDGTPADAQASRRDTRAMGGPGADGSDQARQARMDEAYDNWKSKQR